MDNNFTFGFGGDDIDNTEDNQQALDSGATTGSTNQHRIPESLSKKARVHRLDDLLNTLPSHITYNALTLPVPPSGKENKRSNITCSILRRDYADVRVQMMAEEEHGEYASFLTGNDDIKEGEYEGGFKTWECASDLARLLISMREVNDTDEGSEDWLSYDNIIELGCGSAIPSLVIFQHAIAKSTPVNLTLADYNEEVLRLLTVPNLLLNWARVRANMADASTQPSSSPDLHEASLEKLTGDLEITPSLLAEFLSHLRNLGIDVSFVSGSWHPSDSFVSLLPLCHAQPVPSSHRSSKYSADERVQPLPKNSLVLSSETIYSPLNLISFVDVLEWCLRARSGAKSNEEETIHVEDHVNMSDNVAYIAAKKLYFGVGGGVDAFVCEAKRRGLVAQFCNEESWKGRPNSTANLGQIHDTVSRCVVKIMSKPDQKN